MIELEHIFVSYTKEFNTLQDISFALNDGDKLVIVGEKDSGRTALLRTIVGLDKCKSGTILINGTPIEKINFKDDVSLGFLPSEPVFIENKSVEDNLKYVLDIRSKDKKLINLHVNNALSGYDIANLRDRKLKSLNRLERIKVALARLSLRPLNIIIIDDIFDMLSDYESEKVIKSIKELIKINSATAIVTVATDAIAKKFNYNTVHLKYGSIVEYNEQKEVKE
ncbi:MAG: ATP-binding cassette domain-containing protein [Clostridia bacterium]|nr:ATP-binding cassette domain-containing protein [Clostridia bacterium]